MFLICPVPSVEMWCKRIRDWKPHNFVFYHSPPRGRARRRQAGAGKQPLITGWPKFAMWRTANTLFWTFILQLSFFLDYCCTFVVVVVVVSRWILANRNKTTTTTTTHSTQYTHAYAETRATRNTNTNTSRQSMTMQRLLAIRLIRPLANSENYVVWPNALLNELRQLPLYESLSAHPIRHTEWIVDGQFRFASHQIADLAKCRNQSKSSVWTAITIKM